MKTKNSLIFFLLTLLSSCDLRFFVNYKRIIHNDKGYIVFFRHQPWFFKCGDTVDVKFLMKDHLNGYIISGGLMGDIGWLDSLATPYEIYVAREAPIPKIPDTISVIPVEIRYYPEELKGKKFEKVTFYFFRDDQRYLLRYAIDAPTIIMQISVFREKDVEALHKLTLPLPRQINY